MSRRRLLVLLKPVSFYPSKQRIEGVSRIANPQILSHLDSRRKVHEDAVNFCHEIMRRKSLDWKSIIRDDISRPIHDVDMVIAIGGDGTLLHASHFMDGSIPILGVNSDPTKVEEVEEFRDKFDATRSTGYLCAATVSNFERVLDDILQGRKDPSELSRISMSVNSQMLPKYALNDILIAHPSPAAVSRFSFRIRADAQDITPLVHSRSSGLRVSTAAGSTAAMLSAGGFQMPASCEDLQFMVREPMLPEGASSSLMHGLIKSGQSMNTTWSSKDGMIYIDGSHFSHSIQHGDAIEISSRAPKLKIFLPQHLESE